MKRKGPRASSVSFCWSLGHVISLELGHSAESRLHRRADHLSGLAAVGFLGDDYRVAVGMGDRADRRLVVRCAAHGAEQVGVGHRHALRRDFPQYSADRAVLYLVSGDTGVA